MEEGIVVGYREYFKFCCFVKMRVMGMLYFIVYECMVDMFIN